MIAAVVVLATALAAAVGGIVYLARHAMTMATARAEAANALGHAEGDYAVARAELELERAASATSERLRAAERRRADVLEQELADAIAGTIVPGTGHDQLRRVLLQAVRATTPEADATGGDRAPDAGEPRPVSQPTAAGATGSTASLVGVLR